MHFICTAKRSLKSALNVMKTFEARCIVYMRWKGGWVKNCKLGAGIN